MGQWSRVVVGVDGSEDSARALRWAAEEARAHDATLHVVEAYHQPAPPRTGKYGAMPWADNADWEAEARRRLETELQEVLGEDPGVQVRRDVREGSAAPQLLEACEGADLLVVGTRGRGAFKGMLLGSVSQHLSTHAPCPVAIIR